MGGGNTLIRENVFILAPCQKSSFSFDTAINVRIEENRLYGEIQPLTDKGQVKVRGNIFQLEKPERAEMRGSAEDLATFQDSLKKKGNPQEKHGITVDWIEN